MSVVDKSKLSPEYIKKEKKLGNYRMFESVGGSNIVYFIGIIDYF